MIVRWRLGFCGLERMEFESETPAWYIAADGQRFKKASRMGVFYDTEREALEHILENARSNVKHSERDLRDSKADLRKAEAALRRCRDDRR